MYVAARAVTSEWCWNALPKYEPSAHSSIHASGFAKDAVAGGEDE